MLAHCIYMHICTHIQIQLEGHKNEITSGKWWREFLCLLPYTKTMHALASIQHVQDKITPTSRITLTLHQTKHLPCCTHAGSLCLISQSWLMEHIWMVNLGRIRSPWFPWSDKRNQISDLKEKYPWKKYPCKAWAVRRSSRNSTFLWDSPVQWPHLMSFSLHDGAFLSMCTRCLLDGKKGCAPITRGIQLMGSH